MNKQPELSEEMYRRIYRLIKRQVDPKVIANTVNIPLRTVESILSRFEKNAGNEFDFDTESDSGTVQSNETSFLDIYMYTKTRYAILQIVGTLTSEYLVQFTEELEKAYNSSLKALAVRLSDITSIDEAAGIILCKYNEKFLAYGKYFALLDPSPQLEAHLVEFKIDQAIPIFGTERAFEDAAFSRRSSSSIKR